MSTKIHKNRQAVGPDPTWAAYSTPSYPLAGGEGAHPAPQEVRPLSAGPTGLEASARPGDPRILNQIYATEDLTKCCE